MSARLVPSRIPAVERLHPHERCRSVVALAKLARARQHRIAEARPGQPAVVHHIVAYIMKEGQRSAPIVRWDWR